MYAKGKLKIGIMSKLGIDTYGCGEPLSGSLLEAIPLVVVVVVVVGGGDEGAERKGDLEK